MECFRAYAVTHEPKKGSEKKVTCSVLIPVRTPLDQDGGGEPQVFVGKKHQKNNNREAIIVQQQKWKKRITISAQCILPKYLGRGYLKK